MGSYFLRRLLLLPPTLFGITILVFLITRLVPGGPLERAIMEAQAANMSSGMSSSVGQGMALSEDQLEQLKQYYGFDKPWIVSYGEWVGEDRAGGPGHFLSLQRAGVGRHQVPFPGLAVLRAGDTGHHLRRVDSTRRDQGHQAPHDDGQHHLDHHLCRLRRSRLRARLAAAAVLLRAARVVPDRRLHQPVLRRDGRLGEGQGHHPPCGPAAHLLPDRQLRGHHAAGEEQPDGQSRGRLCAHRGRQGRELPPRGDRACACATR